MGRDWTRDEDYAGYPDLDDSALAWEFLRRNDDFVAAHCAAADVSGWGLAMPADPALPAADALPLWRWDFAPAVVVVLVACPQPVNPRAPTVAELVRRAQHVHVDGAGRYLRFPTGLQAMLPVGLDDNATLAAVLPMQRDFLVRAIAAHHLRSGMAGEWRRISGLSVQRRARLALVLRALDARAAGASYREIARCVLGETEVDSISWRLSSSRALVIRLCESGREMMRRGYRGLLTGRPKIIEARGARRA